MNGPSNNICSLILSLLIRYVFSESMMLNGEGKKLSPPDIIFHPSLSLKMNAPPVLKPIIMKRGGRDVMANILRVLTPGENMYACSLSLGGGIGLFHGHFIRAITSGQLPVIGLKSVNKGKAQGKSSTARLVMKTVSCWSKNKMSYSMAPETIKKRLSQTSLPITFDDVKSDKFLNKITEGFDDGEVYETKEVSVCIIGVLQKPTDKYFMS